jgi:ABC-type Zn uptake system ZnuABC Zn-binding protein ZnuA
MTLRIPRAGIGLLLLLGLTSTAAADALRVVTTTPDLGDLAGRVGGDEVAVTVLVKGPQDPHYVDPRPSFVRKLHDADLYVEIGLDLEIGWAPVLLRGARNPKILPGGEGYLNASTSIRPRDVPTGRVDRSMGDLHIYGNPHYLVDPVNGVRVAQLLATKLGELRPEAATHFRERFEAFRADALERMLGAEVAQREDPTALLARLENGDVPADAEGWLGRTHSLRGVRSVEDHKAWTYFAHRFGLELVATLEPLPGIAPTASHLQEVVELVRSEHARLILATPYFDPRHARWVAERTGARVARMAHQVDSREGTSNYLDMVEYNVRSVLAAVGEGS